MARPDLTTIVLSKIAHADEGYLKHCEKEIKLLPYAIELAKRMGLDENALGSLEENDAILMAISERRIELRNMKEEKDAE